MADKLKALSGARILFGMPSSAAALDPAMKSKIFDLTERGELEPAETLAQKGIALDCKAWAERDGVQFRSAARAKLLHGKMYLADKDGVPRAGVVGSSNFTKRGLGGGGKGGGGRRFRLVRQVDAHGRRQCRARPIINGVPRRFAERTRAKGDNSGWDRRVVQRRARAA